MPYCPSPQRTADDHAGTDAGLTVAERIHALDMEDMDMSVEDMFERIREMIAAATPLGRPVRWPRAPTPRWRTTLRMVGEQCRARGVHPGAYLASQEGMLAWRVRQRMPVYDNLLRGEAALARYQTWARAAGHRYGDANRHARPRRDAMLPAELAFAEHYLGGVSMSDAAALARERNPRWTLREGRRDPWLRLAAVSHFLSAIHPRLPRRIVLKAEAWKWGRLRRELRPLVMA